MTLTKTQNNERPAPSRRCAGCDRKFTPARAVAHYCCAACRLRDWWVSNLSMTPDQLAEHERRVAEFCSEAEAADPSLYAVVCARYPVQSKSQLARRRLRERYLYVNTQAGPNPRRPAASAKGAYNSDKQQARARMRPLHERPDRRLSENQPHRSPGRQAEDFFGTLNPGPCSASETIALAMSEGHKEKTISRARDRLGIPWRRNGKAGPISWLIPDVGQRLSSYDPLTPNELKFNRSQRIRTKSGGTKK